MTKIVQLSHANLSRRVAVVNEPWLQLLQDCSSVYELATIAIEAKRRLRDCVAELTSAERVDYNDVYDGGSAWRLMPPVDHPEPSRCFVMGTGLTHKGSAENRQSMHVTESRQPSAVSHPPAAPQPPAPSPQPLTDSMKMFQIGLDGGRPAPGKIGAAPEWFYKGVGTIVRAHNEPLNVPPFAEDGGEEAEIVGVYIIGENGTPFRIGFTQANEFSDHVLEAQNYLYLAPSKLRDCALGPELVIDADFESVPGKAAIERGGQVIWQAPQASGERAMCHSLTNLEHHHFKYAEHRRPGDLHIHFMGADMFSFKDRLRLEDGDVMEISFEGFGRPLRNPIRIDSWEEKPVVVRAL